MWMGKTISDAFIEVCSAHPTSGGPYFWAAMLSHPKHAAFASWITGWFNLLGQVAVTTGIRYARLNSNQLLRFGYGELIYDFDISFACANFLSTVATFNTSFVPSAGTTIGIYAAVLVAQGLSFRLAGHCMLAYLFLSSLFMIFKTCLQVL